MKKSEYGNQNYQLWIFDDSWIWDADMTFKIWPMVDIFMELPIFEAYADMLNLMFEVVKRRKNATYWGNLNHNFFSTDAKIWMILPMSSLSHPTSQRDNVERIQKSACRII